VDTLEMSSHSSARSAFLSPHVEAVYDYWLALKGDRSAPGTGDIDACEIPRHALPYVLLADLSHAPLRIRYRLVGSHGVEIFGMDYTGKFLDELVMPDDVYQTLYETYMRVVRTAAPVIGRYRWPTQSGADATSEYVLLPLLDKTGGISRTISAEHIGQHRPPHAPDLVKLRVKHRA
jgi:hypothetical protein